MTVQFICYTHLMRYARHLVGMAAAAAMAVPAGAASMSLQEVAEAYSAIVRDLSLSLTLHNAHSGNTQRSRVALNGVRQPLDNIRFAFDRWVASPCSIA
jgi:hypothetical protein